ncbi:hypothetical protein B0H10DRAFT_1828708 [Mycena sp. CBHHK59/15]|nr:hypothetical protein B0H10DRAFT_1828708 [Mycena sp. CBHHK59/15]
MFLAFKLFDKLYYFYLDRYANCAAQFILVYTHELTGADLAWVNKKYHGHRVLPPNRFSLLKLCTSPSAAAGLPSGLRAGTCESIAAR